MPRATSAQDGGIRPSAMKKYLHDKLSFRHGHALSPSSSGGRHRPRPAQAAAAYDQPASALLSKLPPELRAQIYWEVLGGHRVHVKIMPPSGSRPVWKDARWRHVLCQMPGVPFGPLDDYYQCYYQCLGRQARRRLDMGIVLTCRKA